MARSDLAAIDQPLLIRFYYDQLAQPGGLSVDALPYSEAFDWIVTQYNARHQKRPASHREIYQTLMLLRKSGKLVRRKTLRDQPPLFTS